MTPHPLPPKPDADGRRWFKNMWGDVVYGKDRMAYLNYVNAVTGPRPDRHVIERCYLEALDESPQNS